MMKDYGAAGVISVASNVIPGRITDFVSLGLEKRFAEMEKEGARLEDFFEKLFIDTNPIMAKTALGLLDLPSGGFRLPMCETSVENVEKMRLCLATMGLGKKAGAAKA
jgi:4-hydroxy-tetrahydrodipicolinate synthase